MKSHNKFEGLIFDFNGVLFWDDQIQCDSWRIFAAQIRQNPLTDEEIEVHIHGRNGQYTLEYLLGYPIEANKAVELIEQKEALYREMCLQLNGAFQLSPGAIRLLDDLVKFEIPHTIATASAKRNVDFFVDHLNLAKWFDVQKIVYDDGKIPGKPAPDIYLEAARKIDVHPEACVVVEDSRSGIQAAHRAGAGLVIALGPEETHPMLKNLPGVHHIITDIAGISCQDMFDLKGGI